MEEDYELINKYLKGEQDALKMLIDKYTSSIYNFTIRFVGIDNAPDVTQEVFIKVWKNLKNFDNDKAQFKTWLFVIARNTITDFLRKKKMVLFSSLDKEEENFAESIEDDALLPDEILNNIQDKKELYKLVSELPNNYKLVLTLYYQEDMTFKEIGEVLGKPINTVKSYHHRALCILKDKLTII